MTQIDRATELAEPRYLLVKRDLYYAPNNQGYTGVKARAGRYHADDADPESGVTAIHEDDAPMFSKACWEDVKVNVLLEALTHKDAEIARLRAALEPFARLARPINAEPDRISYIESIEGEHGTGELYLATHFGTARCLTMWTEDFRAASAALSQEPTK